MNDRNLLYVAPDPPNDQLVWALNAAGWALHAVRNAQKARSLLENLDVAVGTIRLEPFLSELPALTEAKSDVSWVAMIGPEAYEQPDVRRVIRECCYDYHTLPLDPERLRITVGHAHGMSLLERGLTATVRREGDEPHMVAVSATMLEVFRKIRRFASTDAPVLITGESGTGKELAARAVHERSRRAAGPFVPVNCGALPPNLIHSELFGHEKGAFTGAVQRHIGSIEAASGGTVFLDEIGDLNPELQLNLLRFLQEGTIRRLGNVQEMSVDVRVIAATNVAIEELVGWKRFREDLYFRLNVLRLELPPLRERPGDIEVLAHFFFDQFVGERRSRIKGFSRAALEGMAVHSWPGNVRELINRVRRAVTLCDDRLINLADLGLTIGTPKPHISTLAEARAAAERNTIDFAVALSAGNLSLAARRLGVSRPQLYKLLAKHNTTVNRYRPARDG